MELMMLQTQNDEIPASNRPARRHAFARGLEYGSIVTASERVAWTVDEIFQGRIFDASRAIVPESWVGGEELGFLDEAERLALNHCRAFSYVHLLGNFEEFAPVHLGEMADLDWHVGRAHLRALFRFGEEEIKHQELFLRAERVLEKSCGHSFGRYFDAGKERVSELTRGILRHSPLSRFLMVLALELGTQRHYAESIRDRNEAKGDPLYAEVLRAHWLEEAQHVKTDLLEIDRLADEMGPHEIELAFEDVASLGALVDSAFVGQAAEEAETVQRVTGRSFSEAKATALTAALGDSMRRILAGVGLSHPSFARVALELSPRGARTLGIGAPAGVAG